VVLPALLSVFTFALAAPASAYGTIHVDQPEICTDVGGGFVWCNSLTAQAHTELTPSGNEIYDMQGTSCGTITGPDFYSATCNEFKSRVMYKRGEIHESAFHQKEFVTFNGQTCTTTVHAHEANGEVQFERTTLDCVPA
jgi:hypothetical protein